MNSTTSTATTPAGDDPFVHPALFYHGPQDYLAGIIPFIRQGLRAGEPVAVSVPGPNLALLRAALGGDAERVRLLDMTEEGRNPGRIITGVLRAFADAHPATRVRIIGEPIWAGRSELEYPACAQHEALINLAFTGHDVTILCPYDTDRLDARALADAEATHPVLVDTTGWRPSPGYDRVEEVTVDAATLPSARALARRRARTAGLSPDRIADVELVVAELLANSVDHGGGQGTLRIWGEPGHLVCEVRDAGFVTDLLAGRRPVPSGQPRGRGLLLVNHLADLVRTHTDPSGTTSRVCFRAHTYR
jgi:anti-sigma regulatory factor (Ser/Thr protein kinase)